MNSTCTESTALFLKTVPFIVKAPEKDDVIKQLTVRILHEQISTTKVLKLYISSETDLLFLHTLELTEDDYSRLKLEQGILVDFVHFPQKLISLFDRCIFDSSKFLVELSSVGGSRSEFQFVEINDFTKLSHLKLSFRPGTDQSIKSFLSFRLEEVSLQSQDLRTTLETSQKAIHELKQKLKEKGNSMDELKEKYEALVLEGKSEEKRIYLEVVEKTSQEKEELKLHFENEKQKLEIKLSQQMESLLRRNEELEDSNKSLLDHKYLLDTKCSELTHQLATAEGLTTSLTRDISELREANKNLYSEKQQLQIELSDSQAESKALHQKVSDVDEVVELQKGRISDLDAARNNWECRYAELRNEWLQLKESQDFKLRELEEQYSIVQKLHGELRSVKDRYAKQRAILSKQEDLVVSQERKLKGNYDGKLVLESKIRTLQDENKSKDCTIQDLKTTLMKNIKQLEENELMIRWLNDQITVSKSKKCSVLSKSSFLSGSLCRSAVFSRKSGGSPPPSSVTLTSIDTPESNCFRHTLKPPVSS